jgi:hypothetical protein
MRRIKKAVVWMGFMLAVCSSLHAQDGDESEKINSNLGFSITAPLNPIAHYTSSRGGLTAGAGYNFNEHQSFISEFMWNSLSPTDAALQPIREALQDNTINGHSDLYAMTGNYRYQLQGKALGAYIIGGGGWYHRTFGLSKQVTTTTGITCTPVWRFYGFTCTSGTVTSNETIVSSSSSVLGGNIGVGFTIKVSEPSYRVYFESRYHYAPTKNVNTQLIDVTIGIRY